MKVDLSNGPKAPDLRTNVLFNTKDKRKRQIESNFLSNAEFYLRIQFVPRSKRSLIWKWGNCWKKGTSVELVVFDVSVFRGQRDVCVCVCVCVCVQFLFCRTHWSSTTAG